jgi:hypothetical protein
MLAPILIALGMTAFLAATTQAPLTSFIIVMEMIDGRAMVLSLMAAAMLANLIARLISRPLYSTLSSLMIQAAIKTGEPAQRMETAAGDTATAEPPEAGSGPATPSSPEGSDPATPSSPETPPASGSPR